MNERIVLAEWGDPGRNGKWRMVRCPGPSKSVVVVLEVSEQDAMGVYGWRGSEEYKKALIALAEELHLTA